MLACQELKCTWVEKGESVSNYRAELLGAIGYLLVMKAVLPDARKTDCNVTTLPKCKAFCDNMSVVNHGKQPKNPLTEKQVQTYLLGHMKFLLRTLKTRISFTHVYGHIDKHLDWEDMTKEQQLNVRMDKKAGEALEKAAENKEYIKHDFPHKRLKMECGHAKDTASAKEAIYDWKSRQTAKALYHERNIVDEDSFDLICWNGIRYVMNTRFNKSFATFYTKHVIGCCGVRRHLHHIDERMINVYALAAKNQMRRRLTFFCARMKTELPSSRNRYKD